MNKGREILSRLLSSPVKAELLVLFHRNLGLIDTVDGVARRMGRKASSVDADVKDLEELGLLRRKRIGNSEVIFLDRVRDREVQGIVESYLSSLKMLRGAR